MRDVLLTNIFAGEQIQKSRIPSFYRSNFDVKNLFRYSHPEGHRSCYAIVQRSVLIIDLMSHKEYERRFGY